MPASRHAELERAYRSTTYVVDAPEGAIGIRIGEPCPALDGLLAQLGVTCWAFVTAWNPQSEILFSKINELNNDRLR